MKNFKIRASAAGQIMKNDRSGKSMGQTGYTLIDTWYREQLYNRSKRFTSKYTEKGNAVEEDAIRYAASVYGWSVAQKNELHLSDEYMIGTPDLILSDEIVDIKCSWDCFTFPLMDTELDNSDYFWQMQVYMHLTGITRSSVVYCLMDAPENIIDREAMNRARQDGMTEIEMELFDQVRAEMTYSDLPDSLRIRKFDVAYDRAAIDSLIERVKFCRSVLDKYNVTSL